MIHVMIVRMIQQPAAELGHIGHLNFCSSHFLNMTYV